MEVDSSYLCDRINVESGTEIDLLFVSIHAPHRGGNSVGLPLFNIRIRN